MKATTGGFVTLLCELAELHEEVCQDTRSLEPFLERVGVIGKREQVLGVEGGTGWYRGGAESYVCEGTLTIRGNPELRELRLFCKAYAGFGIGVGPEVRAEQWLERGRTLAGMGVAVPTLYCAAKGVLVSDYIEYDFREWLKTDDLSRQKQGALMLAECLHTLREVAGSSTALLHNLRTDGSRLYVVDFGEDLGHVPTKGLDNSLYDLALGEAQRSGIVPFATYFEQEMRRSGSR